MLGLFAELAKGLFIGNAERWVKMFVGQSWNCREIRLNGETCSGNVPMSGENVQLIAV